LSNDADPINYGERSDAIQRRIQRIKKEKAQINNPMQPSFGLIQFRFLMIVHSPFVLNTM